MKLSKQEKAFALYFLLVILGGLGIGKLTDLVSPQHRTYAFLLSIAIFYLSFMFGRFDALNQKEKKNGKK